MLFLTSQLFEVISLFKPLKKDRIIFSSTANNNFNFNSKYLFLYFLEKGTEYDIYFVINDDILREKLEKKYGKHFLASNTLSGILKISRAKLWVSSVLETPYLPLFFIKNTRRSIVHLGHGVPLKKIVLDEERITLLQKTNRFVRSRVFDYVVSYSYGFTDIMRKAFRNTKIDYLHLGQPRNDALQRYNKEQQFSKIYSVYRDIPEHHRAILYAPTWRSYDTVRFFPFEDLTAEELNEHLKENKTVLFLRKHPYFPSVLDESYLKQSNIYLFDTDFFPEIMDYLSYFDKLITDYSSIYLDFLCLERPIAFIPYDLEEYKAHTGFTIPYEELTPGQYVDNKDKLFSYIAIATDNYSEQRKEIATLVNAKSSGNCEENYQFIQQLLKE